MLVLAKIFGNGMILQRNSTVCVFGETDGKHVDVYFCGKEYNASICDGRWIVWIDTDDTREILTMTIQGDDATTIILEDILLGEVWLAGGQSNMELELKDSMDGENVAKESAFDDIRYYNVPKYGVVDDELLALEKATRWKKANGQECKDMSAVGYYFARKLKETLDVPIGIIDCYYGGTSATCWVDPNALTQISEVFPYLNDWEEQMNSKTDTQAQKLVEDYCNSCREWESGFERLKQDNPDIGWVEINKALGPYPWPFPWVKTSPFRPFGLHKSMISRVKPYTVRGFIYYQGEEDWNKSSYYHKLNLAVVKKWREDFGTECDNDQPFYITQLPMFIPNGVEDDRGWCPLRTQQQLCTQVDENVHMIVMSDCGEFDNIHPIDKKTPGYRLAYRALLETYHMEQGLENLLLIKASFDGERCELEFDNTYGSLCYRQTDGNTLTALGENIELSDGELPKDTVYGFEICGDDDEYIIPDIEVIGDRIMLTNPSRKPIKEIRYAWFNYGVANLYSKEGMPLAPFTKRYNEGTI